MDCFVGWWSVGNKFRRASVAEDCVSVGVEDVFYEGSSPYICLFALPSSENLAPRDNNCCFVGVVDVDFIFVKNRNVVGIGELRDADEGVAFDSGDDVHVLCGMAYVVL